MLHARRLTRSVLLIYLPLVCFASSSGECCCVVQHSSLVCKLLMQLVCACAGFLDVNTDSQPPVDWIFSHMKLVAVIGGAIAAAAIALMGGLAVVDCCLEGSAHNKVAAAR